MTIREIEALSGMTRANIRFYESEGLLTPNRAENGYRDYAQSDLETLRKIRLLRALGLGIDEIRRLSAGETPLDAALEARLHAPWRRFFARAIDLNLYEMTWMVILTDAGLCAMGQRGVTFLNMLLSLLTMLLLEPLLLHTTGTTPGKWLLGLSVRNVNGAKLRYSEAFARTAWLIWRGFGAGIPIYCWVRLYKSFRTEERGEPLDWEEDTEQTAKPFGWKRGLTALLAAAAIFAAGVFGSLAAIGPRYRGEITVAQFAANYNRIASQLGGNAGKLDAEGNWTTGGENTLFRVMVLMNISGFTYETDENGILQSVSIEAYGGNVYDATPTGLMQLSLYAFAGAEKGHICLNRTLMNVTDRLKERPQEPFTAGVDGVTVEYAYRSADNWYRLTMTRNET